MKKHYALYRDGLLLIRTKTRAKAIRIQNDFIHTGKTFVIKEEDVEPCPHDFPCSPSKCVWRSR